MKNDKIPMNNDNIDFSLFLCVESPAPTVEARGITLPYRNYEEELIICLRQWLKYYDVPVFIVYPSNKTISPKIEETIRKLSITRNIMIISDSSEYQPGCGFDLKALSGKLLETKYKHLVTTKYLLNIDVDMYLLQRIKEFKKNYNPNTEVLIGRYTDPDKDTDPYKASILELHNKLNEGIKYKNEPFDTGVVLARTDLGFFGKWYQDIRDTREAVLNPTKIVDIQKTTYRQTKKHLPKGIQLDSIEEWLCSWYKEHNIYNIESLTDYQYGEFYPREFVDLKNLYFYHYHRYPNNEEDINLTIIKDTLSIRFNK